MAVPAHPGRRRWLAAAGAATLFASLTVGALPAAAAAPVVAAPSGDAPAKPGPTAAKGAIPKAASSKLTGALATATSGRHAVFVQFAGTGAADASRAVASQGKAKQQQTAKAKRLSLKTQTAAVVGTAKTHDRQATKLWATTNSVPGVAVIADKAAIDALAARGDVVKISPLVPKKVDNASAAQLTNVLSTWESTGVTGKGIRIGVIDTGIDYTHADFGGPGTVAAYQAAKAASAEPWTPTAKVVGGYDFVGDDYDADPASANYQPVPHPDSNPLDCNSHGTHVSGTAAGFGVKADGTTFTGNYKALTAADLNGMRIGPGMAPQASLYALKVFGCEGSTDVVIPAIDWALDPNGDGDFSDHLDVINMSLGSDYSVPDDPESVVVDSVSRNGLLVVRSAGNGGDLTDIGADAVRSLAVANTVDARETYDGIRVDAPAGIAGVHAGQMSVAYDWDNAPDVSGTVAAIPGANADGCQPLSAADAAKVKGKVAWLEWDDNDATRRCGSAGRSANVVAAGAIGALFTSTLNSFSAGITGSDVAPVFQLTGTSTDALRPAVDNGLTVTFSGSLRYALTQDFPGQVDTVNTGSSRGSHGSVGVVKPDVAAPGTTIASAGMGTGNNKLVISGTSMASPHVAGIAALVKKVHPTWTPEQVKAAVMNTAGHDLYTGQNRTGDRYGPARVGAGRVDALAAVNTQLLAYSTTTPGAVTASFGVVPVDSSKASVTKQQKIKVQNTGTRAADVVLSYEGIVNQPGVSYTVSPRVARVPARGSVSVTVTMRVTVKSLRHTIDPTMDTEQLGVPRQYVSDASGRILVSQVGKADLRVPVFGAAKPVSTTTARAGKIGRDPAIILKGNGVAQGSGSTAYTSFASVLQLGAKSPKLPNCSGTTTEDCVPFASQRAGDLKYVGAGASPSGTGYADGWLWFGLQSFGKWATIGTTVRPIVMIDTTGDGEPDFEVDVQPYPETDLYVAVLYDLASGDMLDLEPVNFNFGDVDTNIFDTDVLTIPVVPALIGVTDSDESFPITYEVHMNSAYTGADIDSTGPIAFDVADPGVSTDDPLYQDAGKVGIPYTLGSKTAKKGTNALVLHLHGADGKRADVVKLAGAGNKSKTVTPPKNR